MTAPSHKPPYVWACHDDRPVATVFRVWLGGEDRFGVYLACAECEVPMGLEFTKLEMESGDG